MKKILLTLLLLCSLVTYSNTPNQTFSKANELYKKGDYSKAIELYQSIDKKGLYSDDLYFNLGNCYYKLNKVAPSIYYYEKALKLNPAHEDALINIDFAKRMTIDVVEELPKTFLQRFSANIIQKFSFDTWAIFAVIASFLTGLLFLLYYFSFTSKLKLFLFNISTVAFFSMMVFSFFAFKNYNFVENNRNGIIFSEKVSVNNSPTLDGEEVFVLHEGTKVRIEEEIDNWVKIKLTDGKIGWIYADKLKEI